MGTAIESELSTALTLPEPVSVSGVTQAQYDKQLAFREDLQRNMPAIMAAIPEGVRAVAVAQMSLTAALDNPALLDCTPLSLVRAVLKVATLNLQIGMTCDIVPINGKAECWIRVKGIVELAQRAKAIRWARVGYAVEGDPWEHEERGDGTWFRHTPLGSPKHDASNVLFIYARISLMDRTTITEVWPITRAWDHKKKYVKNVKKGSAWETDPLSMLGKTVLKQAMRFAPMSPELRKEFSQGDGEVEGSFEVVNDPTAALQTMDSAFRALEAGDSRADANASTGAVRDAQDGLTLGEALRTTIPGKEASWGGNGGKALADVSDSLLERIVTWIDDDAERAVKFSRLRAAVVMVERSRESATDVELDDDGA